MSDSNKVLLIDETINSPLKLVESYPTPTGNHSGAVIATLFGTLSDYGNETRNDRWYTGSLWKKVFNDELFQEALATKTLYGEADHPLDVENRLETHIPYVSHIVRDPKINEAKQVVEGFLDILDTPNGRIIKTLIDYGCELGVSSRGSGDLTYIDGRTTVDENTYCFVTWDIVARPSNKKSRVHEIDTVDASGRSAFESIKEQITIMRDNNDKQSLRLAESLISKTDIPDKDEVLKMIKESVELEPITDKSNESAEDTVAKSDLDEAYQRIMELKSEVSRLDNENKSLLRSVQDKENTISELNDLNRNLGSMVTSYMDKLSEANSSNHTMQSENANDAKVNEGNEHSEDPLDFSEVTEMIKESSDKLSHSMSEILRKLNQFIETNDSTEEVGSLTEELSTANAKVKELEKSIKNSQNENVRLIRKISSVVNEYFKIRCSQLGLNEQLVRKEFNNRLYEYDIKDIDEVLTEMYSSGGMTSQRLVESNETKQKVGLLQLTGSLVPKNSSNDLESTDTYDDSLVESIRQVRHGLH